MSPHYVICADVCGLSYYSGRVNGPMSGPAYTDCPSDAKVFGNRRQAMQEAEALSARWGKHWIEEQQTEETER